MAAIGSLKGKKLGFGDDIEDDYGNSGMYFNASVFPPHRQEKEVKYYQDIWVKASNFFIDYKVIQYLYQCRILWIQGVFGINANDILKLSVKDFPLSFFPLSSFPFSLFSLFLSFHTVSLFSLHSCSEQGKCLYFIGHNLHV